MKSLLLFIGLAACLMLGACASPATTPVWKYQTTLVAPGKSLMPQYPVTPPPAEAAYLAASPSDRESLLTDAYTAQTTTLGLCNAGNARLSNWVTQQMALYPGATLSTDGTFPVTPLVPSPSP